MLRGRCSMECVMNLHGPRSSRIGNLTRLEWCSAAKLCYSHWLLLHNRYQSKLHRSVDDSGRQRRYAVCCHPAIPIGCGTHWTVKLGAELQESLHRLPYHRPDLLSASFYCFLLPDPLIKLLAGVLGRRFLICDSFNRQIF